MDNVTVVFVNGSVANFSAEEFDVDLTAGPPDFVNRYPYKNDVGEDSAIFLQPQHIAGIFLTKPEPGRTKPITVSLPGTRG